MKDALDKPISAISRDPTPHKDCGTNSGYARHVRNKERPCDSCRVAHNTYQKKYRRGEARKRGESMKAKTEEAMTNVEEEYSNQLSFDLTSPPRFLQSRGRALWNSVTSEYDLTSTQLVALAEACHQSDELEKVTAALASRNVLWFELGEPDEDTGDVQIIINNLLTLRDSKAAKLNLALEKIGVLGKAKRKSTEESSAAKVMQLVQGAEV